MFDPYRKWLGIPPEEQPPNHYRLLGISLFESDLDVIKVAVMQRSAYVRNFQAGKQGDDAARILNEIAAAEACLTTPAKRGPYDAELKRKEAAKKPRPAPAARPAAPKVDPLLEQAAAMTTLSAPWQSPQFSQRPKQTNYLPLAIGGVAVVVVVVLGMVLASMLGGDGETVAQGERPAETDTDTSAPTTADVGEATPNLTLAPQGDPATDDSADNPTAPTPDNAVAVSAPPPAIAPFNAAQARAHQEAWAAHLGVPVEFVNSMGMKFALIPPGEFVMGSTPEEIEAALQLEGGGDYLLEHIRSEAPQHKVILTEPIYLGIHEVTQAEYEQVMGRNPSHFAATGPGKDAVVGLNTAVLPVERVIWSDAVEFCAKLSEMEQFRPFQYELSVGASATSPNGNGYRLPTEAQWEFACRAGTMTQFWSSDRNDGLVPAGWFGQNSAGRTHAVGELKSNPFGIFDSHGNVWEWMHDGWEANYYKQFQEKPALNPSGPASDGLLRVLRGGHWNGTASACRSSHRLALHPGFADHTFGIRVVLPCSAVAASVNPPIAGLATDQPPPNAQEADPLTIVQDFSLATAQLAVLENWTQRSGEWTAQGGRIVGKGEGLMEFKQHFPQDFLLEMTATIRAGTRMRIHLGGSDLYIGDEGSNQTLWLHGTAHANLQGQPLVYQLNRPLKMAIKLHGPNITFTVNGQSVVTARRLKVDTVKLVLQPGDGFSPGDVEFRDFRLGPPPLTPDEAMAAIRAAGGSIEPYSHQGQPVLKVAMTGRGISDEVVANVRWLPNTREIFLGGSNISDAGMAHLAGLQQLEVLGLDDTPLSDAGLAHLVGLPRLSILNVGWSSGRSAITDAGAEHLSKLPLLTSLGVSHTQLTDAGLKHLAKLTRLEVLFLNGIALSEAAVAELKRKLPKANVVQ